MPRTRTATEYAECTIPGDGAFHDVLATLHCRYASIMEDPIDGAGAGLYVQSCEQNFGATLPVPSGQMAEAGNSVGRGNNQGPIIARPAGSSGGNDWAATTLFKVKSAGAATKVIVREEE